MSYKLSKGGILTRRGFLGGSAAALGASTLSMPHIARAAGDEIRALLITGGPLYPKYWEKVVNGFTEKTGIKVKYDLLEFTPLTTKVVTLGAARSNLYDVFSTHTAQIDSFFNYFGALNEYFSEEDLKDFYKVGVDYLVNPKNGHLAAIPRNMDARTQYYRSDVYEEKGLKAAVTWEDLVEVSQKLTGDGRYGLVVPGQGDPAQRTFSDFLWQAGGDWVDESNKPSFNAAPGVEALTYYRDLIQKWKVVPPDAVSYQWNENSTQFSSGAVMDTFDWPGAFATLSNPETSRIVGKWSTAPYVRNKKSISCAISHAMALNSMSKRKDPAVEFIKYTVSPEAQLLNFNEFSNFPSRLSVAKQVVAEASGVKADWLAQLEQTISTGKEWPKLPGFSRVSTLMFSTIERALSNQQTPEDALNQAAAEALQIMTQAGAYN
ncbi:putative amino-acid ABC transporter periplasmic-binding protein y4oP [Kaistia sp. 32K]|uniref:ABC transporter substrate-binding protein n=1 Tax=Kaistia sp. 32K TaxID=2795690 RepID=UPI001915AC4E|nr:sugar ABC transporter substrate-binding protein [Kaistia sp. 32K]BCP55261.1 putative amino-acid ABC transporter periplasmic-binding protein y4oP [Kaistia sp. 32K]